MPAVPQIPAGLDELRDALRQWEGAATGAAVVSAGWDGIDRLLPRGGLPRGALVEWLASRPGAGAGGLAWIAAREACGTRGAVVVVDRRGEFYPPTAVAWGVPLAKIVLVRPRNDDDALWAMEQALRCRGVAAVWCAAARLEETAQRRLQLAAETGGTLGLFLRPGNIRGRPSWADVQFGVEPQPASSEEHRRLRVEVLRCRGGTAGGAVQLEIDAKTGAMRLASDRHESHLMSPSASVPRAAAARRATGA